MWGGRLFFISKERLQMVFTVKTDSIFQFSSPDINVGALSLVPFVWILVQLPCWIEMFF